MKQKNGWLYTLVLMMLVVAVAGSAYTLLASGGSFSGRKWVSEQDYEMLQRYARIETIRRELEENYVVELEDEALMTGAIRGMMASVGDKYTFYYTPNEKAEHDAQATGEFTGIGIVIINNAQGYIEVTRVHENTPAEAAGMRAGDLMVAVDGTPVSGANSRTVGEAVDLVRGEVGSEVIITVLRGEETVDLTVLRQELNLSNVRFRMLDGNIGYIDIYQFEGDASDAFAEALNELEKNNARGLVIDLRNNPGGELGEVLSIADSLLDEGLILYMEDRSGARKDRYSDAAHSELPLAVLINGSSASASEVLAGAVQDHDRGTIVGTQSYGKGIVQTIITFPDDGAGMQYTSELYYTPSGKNIHGKGITPDVIVETENQYIGLSGDGDVENDPQLRAAIEAVEAEIADE